MGFTNVTVLLYYAINNSVFVAYRDAHQSIFNTLVFFQLLAIVQIGLATLGIISGVNFLKLKAWSRTSLELLTWCLIVFVAGKIVVLIVNRFSAASNPNQIGLSIGYAVLGLFMLAIYGVPLGIMLKYLRGFKVKLAIEIAAISTA